MTTKWTQDQTNSKNPEVTGQNTLYNKQEINSALEVILKVMKLDAAQPFNTPVDPVALRVPDYFEVIDNPMDFGTICRNLKNGVKYTNTMDILYDVQYVWDNCSKYYTKGHYLLELLKRLKKKFTKYWTEAGLSVEQPQKMDERASLQPMKETLRGNTNGQYGSVDPDQRQDQICNSQPQPYQHPCNYNMFYPPMQRPQCNMSSYNHPAPAPNPHGDKNGRFSGKGYSNCPFGPGSQGGQFLWRNNPIGSQLYQHRPLFGNVSSHNSHHGWQPRPESAGRRYPFEQGYTDGPMFDHPSHMHQNRPSVRLPHLPTPSSPKAPSQPQHKSFQSQPLLISDDETDLSVSEEDIPSQSPVGYVMRSGDSGPSSSNFQSPQPLEGATRVHLSSSHPPLSHLPACSNKEVLEPSQIAPPQPLTSCGQPHQPQPPPGFGKKDGWGKFFPEPGRCRRTDGKKWQCSRDAVAINQKYCERHIGRGRFRSRNNHSAISTNLAPVAESRNEYSLSTPPVEPTCTRDNHEAGIDEGCLVNPEDQLRSSQILHPEPSSYHGVRLHHLKEISVLGSKAYSGLDKREVPRKHSRPQLKFSTVQLGSNADVRLKEREAPHKRLKESNLCVQIPRQQEAVQTFAAEGNVITQIMGQDINKFVQALDGPSRTEPESVDIDLNANNAEIKEMKGKMASMEQTCAQVASQIANIMSTISDMQKKLSEKDGPPMLSQAAKVSNDSGRPSASGVIIRDIFSRVYHKK